MMENFENTFMSRKVDILIINYFVLINLKARLGFSNHLILKWMDYQNSINVCEINVYNELYIYILKKNDILE
jgi:hypothetical protein